MAIDTRLKRVDPGIIERVGSSGSEADLILILLPLDSLLYRAGAGRICSVPLFFAVGDFSSWLEARIVAKWPSPGTVGLVHHG